MVSPHSLHTSSFPTKLGSERYLTSWSVSLSQMLQNIRSRVSSIILLLVHSDRKVRGYTETE
ncbi:hypothetical protein AUG19_08505 [archaeon 13_1_20CM_2_54_9]|nr:MAG: hypothetical protein AUG19_08505 [archaeon 13_1_20CM_2_54_9]